MAYGTFPRTAPSNARAASPAADWAFWCLHMLIDLVVCALMAALLLILILRSLGCHVTPSSALRVSFAFTCVVLPVIESIAMLRRRYIAPPMKVGMEVDERRLKDAEAGVLSSVS